MAPRAGFDTEQVRDKARKDLLHLLEGVSQQHPAPETAPFTLGFVRRWAAETDEQCAPT
ncbi:hypothetical protein N658DRAFT_492288 [Parathielavia hyrcaniae]|uniref:Uncharacterized protein n=1 Tax=Parathielavia hyrcaniae TaxID=113614 RepID=A0AAN6T6F3_9PEZI|nr:hypothetical protein N658DRAFT_492288 [Parathielavia hyrcaniae]